MSPCVRAVVANVVNARGVEGWGLQYVHAVVAVNVNARDGEACVHACCGGR